MNLLQALKSLTPGQQVALLFVILFGALLLVSAGTFLASLRDRDADAQERFDRYLRDLRAVWVSAIVFWLAWVSGPAGATLLFGIISFLALREYVTLMQTRRGDHRSLIFAFFVVLPVQYLLAGARTFDLFTVFIPVYVFLAVPVLGALAGDPERFLERNAKIQWGIMACIYGLSHAPALLLLDFPGWAGRGAFLVFFLVVVAVTAQIATEVLTRWGRFMPAARHIDRSFSWRAWSLATLAAAVLGGTLVWITPFKLPQAMAMAWIAAASGTFGDFVMRALKKDAGVRWWGNRSSVTGAVGLLDRVAPLCFAAPVFFHSVRWYFRLHA